MAVSEEPIISRIERLDHMLKQLEEIKGRGDQTRSMFTKTSASSSGASTPSSRDGPGSMSSVSTADYYSPKALQKHCLPIDLAILETESKGTLVDRLDHIEHRITKIEEELAGADRSVREENLKAAAAVVVVEEAPMVMKKKKKKGLKYMVNKLVKLGGSTDVKT